MTTSTRVACAALALGAAAVVFFASRSEADQPGAEGQVTAIDTSARAVEIDIGGDNLRLGCTAETVITLNGYAATFEQLVTGQRVKAWFDAKTYEALRIEARG